MPEPIEKEIRNEQLRDLLASWRKTGNLTKAEVAARMGVSPSVISRMENNIAKASLNTLTRYAGACRVIPLY